MACIRSAYLSARQAASPTANALHHNTLFGSIRRGDAAARPSVIHHCQQRQAGHAGVRELGEIWELMTSLLLTFHCHRHVLFTIEFHMNLETVRGCIVT